MANQVSVDLVREIFSQMFKEQEETIIQIITSCTSVIYQRLDKQTQEIQDNNARMDLITKDTEELKLSLNASQDMLEGKMKKVEETLYKQKAEHEYNINELWNENEYLHEKLRDMEDRSRRDNLRIDGLKEMENESWDQTEEALLKMIREKLDLDNIVVERAHRVGFKNDQTASRTIVAKFASWKQKELVLSNARKLKDSGIYINQDYSKATMDIRKEKWETVKNLRKQGTYAVLVYDKVVTKGRFRKQGS